MTLSTLLVFCNWPTIIFGRTCYWYSTRSCGFGRFLDTIQPWAN